MAAEPQDIRPEPVLGTWDGEGHEAPVGEAEYGVAMYFGTPIRVVLDPLSLELTFEEFMDLATELDGEEDVRAIGTVRKFLKAVIHPADFPTFWSLVRLHRQGVEAQMGFGKWIIEQVTGHPTGRLSNSESGQSRTSTNSGDDVSLRVQHRLEEQGRPDLALMVLSKREHDALALTG